MLEQETASIIKFVTKTAENPYPYYWNVPQNFMIPAVYFPTPELLTGGETFLTYYIDFHWYIQFFHKTAQQAYGLGQKVVMAIKKQRNLIPLIAQDGSIIKNHWIRIEDPSLAVIENGTAQLTISWRSRRPYQETETAKAQRFYFDTVSKKGGEKNDNKK